jgi:hypothetical protein
MLQTLIGKDGVVGSIPISAPSAFSCLKKPTKLPTQFPIHVRGAYCGQFFSVDSMEEEFTASSGVGDVCSRLGHARKSASTTIDREYTLECGVAVGGAYVPNFMLDGRFQFHKSRVSKNISSL